MDDAEIEKLQDIAMALPEAKARRYVAMAENLAARDETEFTDTEKRILWIGGFLMGEGVEAGILDPFEAHGRIPERPPQLKAKGTYQPDPPVRCAKCGTWVKKPRWVKIDAYTRGKRHTCYPACRTPKPKRARK
jgi:hypothetical protein